MLQVTMHAVRRHQERVANVSDPEAIEALLCPAVMTAHSFGARYVRLPGRQRVVLAKDAIVTVLPADHAPGKLTRERDWRFEERNDG